MPISKFTATILISTFFTIAFIVSSCKKAGTENETVDDRVPEWVLKQWASQGRSTTNVINQKSAAIYINEQGEPITFHNGLRSDHLSRNITGNLVAPCDQNDENFLDNTFTYLYRIVTYSCGQNFSLSVEYELSTAFTPVNANPSNPLQLSRGRIRFLNQSGTVIYSNNAVTPINISQKGPDPSNPNRNLYKISYTIKDLPNSLMTSYALDQNRPIVYTDCSDVITTTADWQNSLPGGVTGPCNKIDNIYIAPMGAGMVGFGGCDNGVGIGNPSCYYGLESSRPDEHEIEWRKVGDANYGSWPAPYSTPITSADYNQRISWSYLQRQICAEIPGKQEKLAWYAARAKPFPVTGTIEIRYRNVKVKASNNSCSDSNCEGPWYSTTINVY